MYTKFNDFKKINEGSHSDFLVSYGSDIKKAVKTLQQISKIYDDINENVFDKIMIKMGNYDDNVGTKIDRWVSGTEDITIDNIAKFALDNQNKFGTEPQFVLDAIEDWAVILEQPGTKPINESTKVGNLKNLRNNTSAGKTFCASDIDDDSWVKGTDEDKLRPMFKNLPDSTIRPSYDVLRAGEWISILGVEGMIIGIKNGKLLVDVVTKDSNKHEVVKLNLLDVVKEFKKTNKSETKKSETKTKKSKK